jgi:hypothetical protein
MGHSPRYKHTRSRTNEQSLESFCEVPVNSTLQISSYYVHTCETNYVQRTSYRQRLGRPCRPGVVPGDMHVPSRSIRTADGGNRERLGWRRRWCDTGSATPASGNSVWPSSFMSAASKPPMPRWRCPAGSVSGEWNGGGAAGLQCLVEVQPRVDGGSCSAPLHGDGGRPTVWQLWLFCLAPFNSLRPSCSIRWPALHCATIKRIFGPRSLPAAMAFLPGALVPRAYPHPWTQLSLSEGHYEAVYVNIWSV